jgi:hypothetical protein
LRKIRAAPDFALGLATVYLSLWIYEGGNFLSMVLLGERPVMVVACEILPVGTVSSTIASWAFLAKPLQLLIILMFVLVLLQVVSKLDAPMLKASVYLTFGSFIASVYWETLGTFVSADFLLHTFLFGMIAMGISVIVLAKRSQDTTLFQ